MNLEDDIASLNNDIALWKMKYDIWKEQYEDQKDVTEVYKTAYTEEHKLRLRIEKSQRTLGWVPWALVIVESLAIGVFGVYSASSAAN